MSNQVLQILKKYEGILLVGPFPPPLGGVSVYLNRLMCLIQKPSKVDTSASGWRKFFRLFFVLMHRKHQLVHVHVLTIKILTIVFFVKFFRPYKIMITDHNSRAFVGRSKLEKSCIKFFLDRSDYLVVVGAHIKKSYVEQGVRRESESILVCDSFLPPREDEENSILTTYPGAYFDFLRSHGPIVVTNAYKLVLKDGFDLYGIDMCVQLIYRLRKDFVGVGLVIFLADCASNASYLLALKGQIRHLDLEEDIIFVTGQKELWPSFKKADLMVRPTYSDGFGVSVAEAIYFGCPALASDVCERAPGAITFFNRNMEDFYVKAKAILAS